MDKSRIRLLLAGAITLSLAGGGVAVYAHQSGKDMGEALGIERPGEQDAAVADPSAKGTVPQEFTVPGHSVYIDMRTLHSDPPVKKDRGEGPEMVEVGKHGTGPEGVVQSAPITAAAAPGSIVNVAGMQFSTNGDGHPPDTNGVVGPNHFVETVNTSIGIYNKSDGSQAAAPVTYNAFFANSGTAECDANNGGDPTTVYDAPSGKWVIADFAWINSKKGPFYECIAVSSGSDPVASTWTFYSVPAGDGKFPDYPKFGSGPDAVYFTINNFRQNTYTGAGVYAIKRTSLGSASLQVQHVTTSSTFFSLLPANITDSTLPASATEVIASIWNGQISLWRYTPDWNNVANSTFVNNANLSVSYSSVGRVNTPGEQVDSLSPRVMNKAIQRGGSLWLTQTVAAGSTSGVRWYEVTNLTGTPSIRQQSTFAPADSLFRWMPSLAVDKQGNMMVGYNAGNGSVNPAIRYAGRLTGDPLNTLGQTETSLIEGTGAPSTGNFNRWGDYSEMSVDPVDGCTFWFTGEYYAVTGNNWQTRIGSFKFPGCA